jgi:phosphatidylethanolamine-binding protein (PEBP) family uncharacterized protein
MSFALVLKDISILADNNPSTVQMGYLWVMWDIPTVLTGLFQDIGAGYYASDALQGANEWSPCCNYGYFPPCPNPYPKSDSRFTCSLNLDTYSFTLYALPTVGLNLPAPDVDPTTGLPTGNYVVNLGHYIESLPALAVTEYRGTSQAWAAAFSPPPAEEYPCAAEAAIDGGFKIGNKDSGLMNCLY